MKICNRCVFEEDTAGISFDANGVCNYCHQHDEMEKEYPTGKQGADKLEALAKKIKEDGKGKEYDCVIGVSGGCDSSYLLYKLKELGLNPIAAHFDNTWDSRIAVENIDIMLKKLDIDLFTYVMDNEEFNDISLSFMKASVPEIDAPTDIALTTTLYMAAEKYGIKHIMNGHSFRTEGLGPIGWFYFDGKYIEDIHSKFGKLPMKQFPNLTMNRFIKYIFKGIERHRPLYYIDYNKNKTKQFLHDEFGWQWYGGHHMENRYTIFCHNYIMPKKFGIDLRRVEYSALVRSGQISREDALKELETPASCDEEIVEEIKNRLNLTDTEFDEIISLPPKHHSDYNTYHSTFKLMRPLFWYFYKTNKVPKSFYLKYCT